MRKLSWSAEQFPIAGEFRIAHGSVTSIEVITVKIQQNGCVGRGESRPYARYGESCETVGRQIEAIRPAIEAGVTPYELQSHLKAGAARNAVDCALWDLQAKLKKQTVWELIGLPQPQPVQTAYTLSIDTPCKMADAAQSASAYKLLKIKIADMSGIAACQAILAKRPDATLIIDANEALSAKNLSDLRLSLKAHEVQKIALIEQPIAACQVKNFPQDPSLKPILCADESLHSRAELDQIWEAGYRAINIKLDKCGGLTEAVALHQQACKMGFVTMAGCMVGTSLAMAPMMMLAHLCDYADLDGPLLLAKDRDASLRYEGDRLYPPGPAIWG